MAMLEINSAHGFGATHLIIDAIDALIRMTMNPDDSVKCRIVADFFTVNDRDETAHTGALYIYSDMVAVVEGNPVTGDIHIYLGGARISTGAYVFALPVSEVYKAYEIILHYLSESKILYQDLSRWMSPPPDWVILAYETRNERSQGPIDPEEDLAPSPHPELYQDALEYGEQSASAIMDARQDEAYRKDVALHDIEFSNNHPFDDRFPKDVYHRAAQVVLSVAQLTKWDRDDFEHAEQISKVWMVDRLRAVIKEVFRQDQEGAPKELNSNA
jgi:hypothetical protein